MTSYWETSLAIRTHGKWPSVQRSKRSYPLTNETRCKCYMATYRNFLKILNQELRYKVSNLCNFLLMEDVTAHEQATGYHTTLQRGGSQNVWQDPHINQRAFLEKKNEIWLSPMTELKLFHNRTIVIIHLDYTTIADRLRTVLVCF